MNILTLFKKNTPAPVKKSIRSFKGARRNRFTNWIFNTFNPINRDIHYDLKELITRSRDLAKNNELFRSHINNMCKSVIGSEGFRLQSLIKNEDKTLNDEYNTEVENSYWDYNRGCNGYVSEDGLGGVDFDNLILRTFLIDGEVFIRINRNAKNKYGISFELIDSLRIDTNKNQIDTLTQNAIICGVEIDKKGKEVAYWYKPGNEENYQLGQYEIIPASDMIHIFRKEFAGQARGYSEIVASLDSLKQLDDFAVAELIAAKIAACQGIFYERNNQAKTGDLLDAMDVEETEEGEFLTEIAPGKASIVPEGYSVKTLTPTHPNSNFAGFTKAITRKVAASLGISYNRLAHDYEAVNYSSLREASIDEEKFYSELQRFLIDNWKGKQYMLWLKSYIINAINSQLKPSDFENYLNFNFIPRHDDYFDAAKDIIAVERKLKLGLSNPIIELEKHGYDVDDVLDGWQVWNRKLEERNLNFETIETMPLDEVEQYNKEASDPEYIENEEENINN